jgi:hypothetical protein
MLKRITALCGAVLAPLPAHAATLDLNWIVPLSLPYLETLAVSVLTIGAGWVLSRLSRRLGLSIDAARSGALHGAIERAVRYGLNRAASETQGRLTFETRHSVIARSASYLEETMPQTLKHFGLTADALDKLIEAHLPGAMQETTNMKPEQH